MMARIVDDNRQTSQAPGRSPRTGEEGRVAAVARRRSATVAALALGGALAWSGLPGGAHPSDETIYTVADNHEPTLIDAVTPDEGPAPLGEDDEAADKSESDKPVAPPPAGQPEAKPAPAPEESAEEEPPPADVQAAEEASGPVARGPSAGSASTPALRSGNMPAPEGEAARGGEVLAPLIAPGVAVAPPAGEEGDDALSYEPVAAPAAAGSGLPSNIDQDTAPQFAILSLLAAGLAWNDRRQRARLRPRA